MGTVGWGDRQDVGLDPHCKGQGWESGMPYPHQQMGRAPPNLFRAHSKGSANVTEQMSHWRTRLAASATCSKAAYSKTFTLPGSGVWGPVH